MATLHSNLSKVLSIVSTFFTYTLYSLIPEGTYPKKYYSVYFYVLAFKIKCFNKLNMVKEFLLILTVILRKKYTLSPQL